MAVKISSFGSVTMASWRAAGEKVEDGGVRRGSDTAAGTARSMVPCAGADFLLGLAFAAFASVGLDTKRILAGPALSDTGVSLPFRLKIDSGRRLIAKEVSREKVESAIGGTTLELTDAMMVTI